MVSSLLRVTVYDRTQAVFTCGSFRSFQSAALCPLSAHCLYISTTKNTPNAGRQLKGKMFLHGPDKRLIHFALGLRKHDLRILVGLLTGHCALNRHLAIMHIQDDPLCPACGEEQETPLHLLGKCCATMQTRYHMLGAYTLQLEELCKEYEIYHYKHIAQIPCLT